MLSLPPMDKQSWIRIGDKQVFSSAMDLRRDGCLAKLDRAYEHMRSIHDELVVFFQAHPYVVAGHFDPDTGWYVVRVVETPQPSSRIGVLVGEFAHQLRSILDHLVAEIHRWDFAQERKGAPKGRSVFIAETSPKNFREKAQSRIGRLPTDWQDLIERMQPYHAKDNMPMSQLDWLEDVWNADKHVSVYKIPHASTCVASKVTGRRRTMSPASANGGGEKRPRSYLKQRSHASLLRRADPTLTGTWTTRSRTPSPSM